MTYQAALVATLAFIIAAKAIVLWIAIFFPSESHSHADLYQALVLTAISMLVSVEAYLLARQRLKTHSVERTTFHVAILVLTVLSAYLDLTGKDFKATASYIHANAFPWAIEAGVGVRSLLHTLRALLDAAAQLGGIIQALNVLGLPLALLAAALFAFGGSAGDGSTRAMPTPQAPHDKTFSHLPAPEVSHPGDARPSR